MSIQKPEVYNPDGDVKIITVDCGMKYNQIRCLVSRGASVEVVPWNYDFNQGEYQLGNTVLGKTWENSSKRVRNFPVRYAYGEYARKKK